MKNYFFTKALTSDGWHNNVLICVNDQGIISSVTADASDQNALKIDGYAIAGMPNIHSHAFQRAMAGLAEYSVSSQDSFWTWRDLMYRFAAVITPEDLKTIADQLYMEMLKAGYVSVAEFHYLHHAPDDAPYQSGAKMSHSMTRGAKTSRTLIGSVKMSHAIINSALRTGIALTHLPVLYNASGFGGQPLKEEQKRFSHNVQDFCTLLSELNIKQDNYKLGMAFHSLRAVQEPDVHIAINHLSNLDANAPIHIHIAEQIKEVEDCIAWSNKRPIEWLNDAVTLDKRWCLIHATHLNSDEIRMIASSGAVVGICPTTEANLGDGLFPLSDYLTRSGRFAIGSDSHISVSAAEELRLLEYGQRLTLQQRNITAAATKNTHTGAALYHEALKGGVQASGFDGGAIEKGRRADIITLDPKSALLAGTPDEKILDRFIFNGSQNMVNNTIVLGRLCVKNYRHFDEDNITAAYIELVEKLQKRVSLRHE